MGKIPAMDREITVNVPVDDIVKMFNASTRLVRRHRAVFHAGNVDGIGTMERLPNPVVLSRDAFDGERETLTAVCKAIEREAKEIAAESAHLPGHPRGRIGILSVAVWFVYD